MSIIILRSLICILNYVIDFDGCLIDHIDSCETSPINVTLECNVIFSGKFAPPIQWVNADGDIVNQGVVTTNQSDSVTSTLVIEIENLNIISDYTCHAALSRASCKPNNSDHCEFKKYLKLLLYINRLGALLIS